MDHSASHHNLQEQSMAQIISSPSQQSNKNFSESTNGSGVTTRFLPKRVFQLLNIIYEDFNANSADIGISRRPMQYYEMRFKVSYKTIQTDFKYLEDLGFVESSPGGRGNARKRWITE